MKDKAISLEEARCAKALEYLETQPSKALELAHDTLDSAMKLSDTALLSLAYATLARCCQVNGDSSGASIAWHQSLEHGKDVNNIEYQVKALNALGEITVNLGDYSDASRHFMNALELANQNKLVIFEGIVLNNIAGLHQRLGENEMALTEHRKAQEIFRKKGDKYREAVTSANLAFAYLNLGQNALKEDNPNRANNWFESAKKSLKFAFTTARELKSHTLAESAYSSSAQIYRALGQNQEALKILETSLERARAKYDFEPTAPRGIALAQAQTHLAVMYLETNEPQRALPLLEAALERDLPADLKSRAELTMSQTFEQLADFKSALEHHKTYLAIMLDLHSAEASREAARFETKLALERAKREAERLEVHSQNLETQVRSLDQLSRLDGLTLAPNRRFFDETLKNIHDLGGPFCLALFDGDSFKKVNDTFGHTTGDEVLKMLAKITKSVLRQMDFYARYGGEEFVIIFKGATLGTAKSICERMRLAIQNHTWQEINPDLKVTASFGLTDRRDHPKVMLEAADQALYRAKANGKNQVQTSS